jgi:hypothetical protein
MPDVVPQASHIQPIHEELECCWDHAILTAVAARVPLLK